MDVDLENGNGAGGGSNDAVAADLRRPDQADPHKEERQPFTWLRAAPYIAAALVGAAFIAGSFLLNGRSCKFVGGNRNRRVNTLECDCAALLGIIGVVLVLAIAGRRALNALLDCECCAPRLEADG